MPYPIKGECRNTGRTHFEKGFTPWNKQPEIWKNCELCNKKFRVKPCRIDIAKFCSRKCTGKFYAKNVGKRFFKGDNAGYAAKHERMVSLFGKPTKCEMCDNLKNKRIVWSNKNHKYNLDRKNWQQLCDSCHMKYDYKNNGRRNQHMVKNDLKTITAD